MTGQRKADLETMGGREARPPSGETAPKATMEPARVRRLLDETADRAAGFLEELPERPVNATATAEDLRSALDGPLREGAEDPRTVLSELAAAVDPGLVASAGGRYFGFVIAGGLPAALLRAAENR